MGSTLGLVRLAPLPASGGWRWLHAGLVSGYAFARIGRFGFQKNRPTSFRQPLHGFMGDWRMWFGMLTGRIRF